MAAEKFQEVVDAFKILSDKWQEENLTINGIVRNNEKRIGNTQTTNREEVSSIIEQNNSGAKKENNKILKLI